MDNIKNLEEEIKDLKNKIAEKKSSLPAHSIKPSMIQDLEDLEEELKNKENRLKKMKKED